jgi:tetratricopeptide (TPR) repeat protein
VNGARIFRVLNREVFLLIALFVLSVLVFLFTRRMAALERQMEARVAAVWFERGERAMQAGQTGEAVQAFRKATANENVDRRYMLALADALTAAGKREEAENLLSQLREADPQDAEINVNLARLSAKQGAVQQAVHYYQNALYGRWPANAPESHRQLRIELVHYLVQQQQSNLASSELLILQANTPDSADAHLELAQLFEQSGDARHAQQEFDAAARAAPNNFTAVYGAGAAAIRLQDYPQAERYLRQAIAISPNAPDANHLLAVIELMQSADPLAASLSPSERLRRLLTAVSSSKQRLDACLVSSLTPASADELRQLEAAAQSLQDQLNRPSRPPDFDAVRSDMELVFRIQQAAAPCSTPKPEDEALLLLAHGHTGVRP